MKLLSTMLAAILLATGCVPAPQDQGNPYGHATQTQSARPRAERRVAINSASLDDRGWQVIEAIEAHVGAQLPDGAYWYDPMSGAFGMWGGPAAALKQFDALLKKG